MIIIPPIPARRHRNAAPPAAPTPPPAPLELVAATYDENEAVLTLTFDRAVNAAALSGFNGAAVTVKDGLLNGLIYHGASASLAGPNSLAITLVSVEPYAAEDVTLNATAGTGIVAADDGGAWAGTAGVDVVLPFP